jgi:glycosidase
LEELTRLFELHISRAARDRYRFDESLFSFSGNVVFANLAAVREFVRRINADRPPEKQLQPGELNAAGFIDEAIHVVSALYRVQRNPRVWQQALERLASELGAVALDGALVAFCEQFPGLDVYRGRLSTAEWLAGSSAGLPHRAVALEEMVLLWVANANPAFRPLRELFDDGPLAATAYGRILEILPQFFESQPRFGPKDQNLLAMFRSPAIASPDSLAGQLAYIREHWGYLLGELLQRLLTALDVLKEEEIATWLRFHPPGDRWGRQADLGDSSEAAILSFRQGEHEYERFSSDTHWMPRTAIIAKNTYVWLDQLSRAHNRSISRLDQIPDEELDLLARRGFNALWLIGLWERSPASRRIKQLSGNADAVSSAYSIYDYNLAADLGGEEAYVNLRNRAWARGIRLASDMVTNHMGIDSPWVVHHPERFLSLPYSPFPAYTFDGPDLSSDGRVEIKVEDHYYNRSDAAVVFRRHDRWTGETRFIYHGNDGTSYPWNDTAQLDYLNPETREAVIQTILQVARRFPIIRFDAAMTLAKRHYQRLWFPQPGTGGAIPSRAEHGLTKPQFDAAMPQEFWREVVDRVAAEVPDTLLLAEAFWFMEGYFVRTLGMHRVYNSAFMNMLRDEENANYRKVLKNTLEFDPEVLKRYVNFMNNPDERTAVDQFGKGDKYFGICTMMVTLPGLPMFGHGQIEGLTEKYGMDMRRPSRDEHPDPWLVARHEREIVPLLHRRALFAESKDFLLYDFFTPEGGVNEDVFAYSNRFGGERALVVYHNRFASTRGWIRVSCAFVEKLPGGGHLRQRTLGESFGFNADERCFFACRDALSGLEHLYRSRELAEKGFHLELEAYSRHVFLDWRETRDDGVRPWGELCDMLAGRGVASLDDALRALELKPVHAAFTRLLQPELVREFAAAVAASAGAGDGRSAAGGRETPGARKPVQSKTSAATPAKRRAANRNAGPAAAETPPRSLAAILDRLAELCAPFLHEARRFAEGPSGEAGMESSRRWSGDRDDSLREFRRHLAAAALLPQLHTHGNGFDLSARDRDDAAPLAAADGLSGPVIAWCALLALGHYLAPERRPRAAAELFDGLRLREPLASALESLGYHGEDRWRAAARVRALLAHQLPGGSLPTSGGRQDRMFEWIRDPDVAWLIGVNEYQGARYFRKEAFESLLWWMAMPKLVEAAAPSHLPAGISETTAENPALREIETRIAKLKRAAEEGGYRVDALLEL